MCIFRICADMLYMEELDPQRDITMYIHTKAISSYALNALVDVMQYVKPDVATVCVGTVAGVASTVLAAGQRYDHTHTHTHSLCVCV